MEATTTKLYLYRFWNVEIFKKLPATVLALSTNGTKKK